MAKAGTDYVAQSGALTFAPLEVSKSIDVHLLRRAGDIRLSIEFRNPSPRANYASNGPMPIEIETMPELRLFQAGTHGNQVLRVYGTVPGKTYVLEHSPDLRTWTSLWGQIADSSVVEFERVPRSGEIEFFRVGAPLY